MEKYQVCLRKNFKCNEISAYKMEHKYSINIKLSCEKGFAQQT